MELKMTRWALLTPATDTSKSDALFSTNVGQLRRLDPSATFEPDDIHGILGDRQTVITPCTDAFYLACHTAGFENVEWAETDAGICLKAELAEQEIVGHRLTYKDGSTTTIDRAPNAFELQECMVESVKVVPAPEGWPTEAMTQAGVAVDPNDHAAHSGWVEAVLQAALAAAPTPPTQPTPDEYARLWKSGALKWENRRSASPDTSPAAKPKFDKTYCSQCGGEFGPGDHGYSTCASHRKPAATTPPAQDAVSMTKALQPFAEIGAWLFARDLPDETPVVEISAINGVTWTLTMGHFKTAHTAYSDAPTPPAPEVEPVAVVKWWNVGGTGEFQEVQWTWAIPQDGTKLYTHPADDEIDALNAERYKWAEQFNCLKDAGREILKERDSLKAEAEGLRKAAKRVLSVFDRICDGRQEALDNLRAELDKDRP